MTPTTKNAARAEGMSKGVSGAVKTDAHQAADSIEFRNISMRYIGERHVVNAVSDVNLRLDSGSFVSLVGPSGCGKSTLLKMVAGLVAPTSGEVLQADQQIAPKPNIDVGYIPQHDNLLPWRTALGNVEFPLECRGVGKEERRQRAKDALSIVGLADFPNAYPSELSGGMRKRVSIARILSHRPRVLLADEPFGALDAQLKSVMGAEFQRIWSEIKSTVLFVTHDLIEAIILSDRVVVMSSRPGQVIADDAVPLDRPRDVFTARFDDKVASLHAELWHLLEDDIRKGEEM